MIQRTMGKVTETELKSCSVSVVIPAYNAATYISRAIDSVLSQTISPLEVIVIDDGSQDDIASSLSAYDETVRLIRQPNAGASAARNRGIDASQGEFIAFLDADDYWEPHKLERQLSIFESHPHVGLVSALAFTQNPDCSSRKPFQTVGGDFDRVLEPSGLHALDVAMKVWTGTTIIRRDVLGNERFDTSLSTAEDRDLWMRLVLRTPTYLISEPLATAVLLAGSLSRGNVDRDCANMLRVVKRYRSEIGSHQARRRTALAYRLWAARHLGNGCPRQAIRPAIERLVRQPLSLEAWWILAKSCFRTVRNRATAN